MHRGGSSKTITQAWNTVCQIWIIISTTQPTNRISFECLTIYLYCYWKFSPIRILWRSHKTKHAVPIITQICQVAKLHMSILYLITIIINHLKKIVKKEIKGKKHTQGNRSETNLKRTS